MKTLTEPQKKIIAHFARKSVIDVEEVIKRVEDGVCTISELSLGILGDKIPERFIKKSF